MWRDAHERIALSLDCLQRDTGVSDAEVAIAVRAIAQAKPPSFSGAEPAHLDALYRLAWLLFIRAPALRPAYLALAPMTLELVVAGERRLADLLEDLRALEATLEAEAEVDPESGLHRLARRGGPKDLLERSAARIEEIADIGGDELRALVEAPLARLRAGDEAFDDLADEALGALLDDLPDIDERGMLSPHRAWATPQAIDAQLARAHEALDRGDLARAAAAFERALDLAPPDWEHRERTEAKLQQLLDELFSPEP